MSFHLKKVSIFILIFLFFSCNKETSENVKSPVPKLTQFKPVQELGEGRSEIHKIYVPIYSSIYNQFEENLLHLSAILSIRNTSIKKEIRIERVDYYDTNGKLIKHYLKQPFILGKMSTKDYVISENELEGGTGANFIVEWSSHNDEKVSSPLVESIMMGTVGTKGFSFSSRGRAIEKH